MDHRPQTYEILAHFDRPKTIRMPEFESVDELLSDEPAAPRIEYFDPAAPWGDEPNEPPRTAQRGVRWVLQWAAAIAVLGFAGSVLVQFAYMIVAEHRMVVAAKAAAMEATLPRASCKSVADIAERRLVGFPRLAEQLQVSVLQNGSQVQRTLRPRDGDAFVVMLSAPRDTAIPEWLRPLVFWHSESRIHAEAERRIPGRKLRTPSPTHTAAE